MHFPRKLAPEVTNGRNAARGIFEESSWVLTPRNLYICPNSRKISQPAEALGLLHMNHAVPPIPFALTKGFFTLKLRYGNTILEEMCMNMLR